MIAGSQGHDFLLDLLWAIWTSLSRTFPCLRGFKVGRSWTDNYAQTRAIETTCRTLSSTVLHTTPAPSACVPRIDVASLN
jgi:hypothetical protein